MSIITRKRENVDDPARLVLNDARFHWSHSICSKNVEGADLSMLR